MILRIVFDGGLRQSDDGAARFDGFNSSYLFRVSGIVFEVHEFGGSGVDAVDGDE